MKKYVLIVAGGKGLRMGGELPKQFIPMRGKPILMHTLDAFHRWDAEAGLVLVLPEDHQAYWRMLCKELGCPVPHRVVNGGETRFHSVRNGLAFISKEVEKLPEGANRVLVGVHDGVRPFVTPDVIRECFFQADQSGAAIPVIPVVDSLREFTGSGSRPVDRSRYLAVQTPQVFNYEWLRKAYDRSYSPLFTDDASVVETVGYPVVTVSGNRENIKITTPFDLLVAEALFNRRNESAGAVI